MKIITLYRIEGIRKRYDEPTEVSILFESFSRKDASNRLRRALKSFESDSMMSDAIKYDSFRFSILEGYSTGGCLKTLYKKTYNNLRYEVEEALDNGYSAEIRYNFDDYSFSNPLKAMREFFGSRCFPYVKGKFRKVLIIDSGDMKQTKVDTEIEYIPISH